MTFSALDSDLLGPLFATDAMRAVFSDRGASCRHAARRGRPGAGGGALPDSCPRRSPQRSRRSRPRTSTSLLWAKARPLRASRPFRSSKPFRGGCRTSWSAGFHKGATTQDIVDTALVLQMREGFRAHRGRTRRNPHSPRRRWPSRHRTTPVRRAHLWPARRPGHLRLQGRGLVFSGVAEVAGPAALAQVPACWSPRSAARSARWRASATRHRRWWTPLPRSSDSGRPRSLGTRAAPAWPRPALGSPCLLGALAKFATDVAHLASTEVGEVAEPHVPGRGGSSAMPPKRNPVSSTVILAAHAAAQGARRDAS